MVVCIPQLLFDSLVILLLVLIICARFPPFLAGLSKLALVSVTAYLAVRTRKLETHLNESKYIAACVFVCCVVVMLYILMRLVSITPEVRIYSL